jgi:inner membrane protein
MDTITQMTLGAAMGETVLGRKVGNKAILWGALAGAVPDLDVLAGPFMDPVNSMAFHRGITHSLVFALLFAPLLGYLIYGTYGKKTATWLDWSKLAFWSVVTHPLLDIFTSYGTQFFWPFSDYRIALSTIFVIDPLYTVPFLVTVIALMFYDRSSHKRRVLNYLGITVSTVYLAFTTVNKLYVSQVFYSNLQRQNIRYNSLMTAPTPMNNFLWRGVAETEDGFREGYYSLFDNAEPVSFTFTPKNHELIRDLANEPRIQKLIWITKGYYSLVSLKGTLYLHDMRYGRLNGWGKFEGEFIFSFRIEKPPGVSHQNVHIFRERASLKLNRHLLKIFALRLLGNTHF